MMCWFQLSWFDLILFSWFDVMRWCALMWRYVIWFDRVEVIWFQWVDWSIWLSDWGHWLIWFMWCIWCDCRYVLVLVVLAWIDVFDAIWFCEFIRFYVVWCDVVRLNCVELNWLALIWVGWFDLTLWVELRWVGAVWFELIELLLLIGWCDWLVGVIDGFM